MRNMRFFVVTGILGAIVCAFLPAAESPLDAAISREIAGLVDAYKFLHSQPELSRREEKTAAFMARGFRSLGFEVTEQVGRWTQPDVRAYGVVAVMKNGAGPTVMLRADMDALPVLEKTGLPYASRVKTSNENGEEVSVMHACGHDTHMTSLLGAAKVLTGSKERWHGTLMLVAQPAEERYDGAKAMLDDGLYARFGKPDFAVALHADAALEAGKIGFCEGYALANVNSVDVTVRGRGGHGAYPHLTKDPIVLAAEIVMALQTIVSRENSPFDPAVVTVGSIHGGSKHNVIPDEVHLQLTLRSYKEEVRTRLLQSIERIVAGIAASAGIPPDRAPIVTVSDDFTPATYNNPELTRNLSGALRQALGSENVVQKDPVMGGEDFGRFSLPDRSIPVALFWLGAVDPVRMRESREKNNPLPSLHSSEFAPAPEPTLRTGVTALTSIVLHLMK